MFLYFYPSGRNIDDNEIIDNLQGENKLPNRN